MSRHAGRRHQRGQLMEDSKVKTTGMHHIGPTVAALDRSPAYHKELFALEPS